MGKLPRFKLSEKPLLQMIEAINICLAYAFSGNNRTNALVLVQIDSLP